MDDRLESLLPEVLTEDSGTEAVVRGAAEELWRVREEASAGRVYTAIGRLPEAVLDILAKDFAVEWWDYNAPVEEKRSALRESFAIHRVRGTKGAVTRGVQSVYPGSRIEEWWEYGGQPYSFRIVIDAGQNQVEEITEEQLEDMTRSANFWKNARSWLDGTIFRRDREMEHGLYTGHIVGMIRAREKDFQDPGAFELTFLTDEKGVILADGHGDRITI